MPNNWKTEADAPSAYPLNSATTFFSGNSFAGIDQCIVTTYAYNLNAARQIVSFLDNTGVKYRLAIGEDQWGAWKQIPTATPPQEFALPLADGVSDLAGYKNTYSKDQFGIVRVWFSVHFESIPSSGAHVFVLPEGFRPDFICCSAAILSVVEYYNVTVSIHPSGAAIVDHGTIGQTGPINLHGCIEFPAD